MSCACVVCADNCSLSSCADGMDNISSSSCADGADNCSSLSSCIVQDEISGEWSVSFSQIICGGSRKR